MTMEMMAMATSAVAICMCALAFILDPPSRAQPRRDQTLTITIEDSAGGRARTVARSDRRADDVKRDVDRLVGQTP